MATRLGIRQQTVSEWETGQYEPRGTSVTLLGLVAENSRFEYGSERSAEES
jgi:DNA-binding transcriptional regulator YiaG